MKFNFLFETSPTNQYVGVLSDTHLLKGFIASQNAGSTNSGIYHQVGGGGVNLLFMNALGPSLTASVNGDLVVAYDARFGKGAWQKDKTSQTPPLTSFYIPLPAGKGANVGKKVAGMVYSVGPVIDDDHVTDRDQYRQIHVDALNELASVNKSAATGAKIEGLRITMLSTGIYGPSDPKKKTPECRDVAAVILEALEAAAKGADAAYLPATIPINCATDPKKTPASKEIDAFTFAATALKITVTKAGFELDC